MKTITEIISLQQQGIYCSEEESAEIKQSLLLNRLPFEQIKQIIELFPLEYSEFTEMNTQPLCRPLSGYHGDVAYGANVNDKCISQHNTFKGDAKSIYFENSDGYVNSIVAVWRIKERKQLA